MSFWGRRPAWLYFPGVYAQGAKALLALGGQRRRLRPARLAARQAYRIARPADFLAAAATVVPDAAEVFAGFGIRSR